ncbi:DNA polymerase III subunit epsilon [Actinobacillus equuli]|nr:DNA polymerase III subunit epsilon [Actinobacillus equuli]
MPLRRGVYGSRVSYLENPPPKTAEMCSVTDSLAVARKMYPGKRNNLDALCDRLGIDNSKRVLHGALLDAEILADVFLMMTGGQLALLGEEDVAVNHESVADLGLGTITKFETSGLLVLQLSEEEQAAHEEYLKLIDKNPREIVFGCAQMKRNQSKFTNCLIYLILK